MNTATDIVNLALLALGQNDALVNLEGDTSPEGVIYNKLYDKCLRRLLKKHFWSFATSFQKLTLIEEDPLEDILDRVEYQFSYIYPTDCLYIRRVVNETTRSPIPENQVTYKTLYDRTNSRLIIYTDMEDAVIEYTTRDVVPCVFPDEFEDALVYLLAYESSRSILASNSSALATEMYTHYVKKREEAIAIDTNSQQQDPRPMGSVNRARFGLIRSFNPIHADDSVNFRPYGNVYGRV